MLRTAYELIRSHLEYLYIPRVYEVKTKTNIMLDKY